MKNELLNDLVASIKEMQQFERGERAPSRVFVIPKPDVVSIRKRLGLSQSQFALLIGVSKRTVEGWEQERREPEGPARALLRIFEVDPKHAAKALHSARR